jgi:hypothetical protein
MELNSPGPNAVPNRLFSVRTRLPVAVVEKRSVTAVPKSMGVDVWKGAAVEWEAARFENHPPFPFPVESALDVGEETTGAKRYAASLFTREEASAVLDLLAAEVPNGTHELTAVELPITAEDVPREMVRSDAGGWGHVTLGGKTNDEWGTLGSLYGTYNLSAAEYAETIGAGGVDPPAIPDPIRPLSDLADAVQAARYHVKLQREKETPF